MKDPIKSRYDEVAANLDSLREQAGTTWRTREQARAALDTAPDDKKDEATQAFIDADKAHGELADAITQGEAVKAGLVDALARNGNAPRQDDDRERRAAAAEDQRQTMGQRIVAGDAYQDLVKSGILNSKAAVGVRQLGEAMNRDEFKALITGAADTSAGAFVQPDRIGYFPLPLRPLTVLDMVTVGDTDSDLVEYVEQTTFTNAAAEVAEATSDAINAQTAAGGAKPQSHTDFVIRSVPVRTVAHWMAATRRALSDAGQMRTIIDGLLRYGLDRRVEDQVVAGDGLGENLRGLLNFTGTNQIPAGPASIADKVHFGLTQVTVDGFAATGVLMNPFDWETVRLSRENGDGTGAYLFGPPSAAGPQTLWGRGVAVTPAIPQGTAIVGDLRAFIVWVREGTQVLASDSHADFFTRNLIAVLAENRLATGLPYPQAIAEVNLAAV
jgi:HK97 family phage major capsid protein